jgi:flagellar biosynthesis protein FlhG
VANPEPTALTDAYALLKVFSKRPEARRVRVSVIMNRCQGKEEAVRSFDRLRTAARRFLDLEVQYMGAVGMDDTVGEATRRQVAFLTHYAGSPCSRDVRKIAARIVSAARDGGADVGRFFKTIGEAADE